MYSVGIDISKEKRITAIMSEHGEVIARSTSMEHTQQDLSNLCEKLRSLNGETRIDLEATGAYHLPVVTYL